MKRRLGCIWRHRQCCSSDCYASAAAAASVAACACPADLACTGTCSCRCTRRPCTRPGCRWRARVIGVRNSTGSGGRCCSSSVPLRVQFAPAAADRSSSDCGARSCCSNDRYHPPTNQEVQASTQAAGITVCGYSKLLHGALTTTSRTIIIRADAGDVDA